MRQLSVAVFSLAFVLSACGPAPSNKCTGIQCPSGSTCDVSDGQCKPNGAGGGRGGGTGGATGGGTGGATGGGTGGATGGGTGGATGGGTGGATGGGTGGATGGGTGGATGGGTGGATGGGTGGAMGGGTGGATGGGTGGATGGGTGGSGGASNQIAAARAAADAGIVSIAIRGALVTYVIQTTIGSATDDPAGFFVQSQQMGPAVFVAVDPATLTPAPAVGDAVDFNATEVEVRNGHTKIRAISNYSRASSGNAITSLAQNVTTATNLVSALDSYESELITITGTLDGGFSTSGALHSQANFVTTGVSAPPLLRFRAPDAVLASLDLQDGCSFTLQNTPMWRFQATAQPSAWKVADLTNMMCAAPVVSSAVGSSATTVTVRFSRKIAPASIVANGSQFTIPGLSVTAAVAGSAPTDVVVTTATQANQNYTVTVSNTLTDTLGVGIGMPNSAMFAGFQCTPNAMVISQVYGNGGNMNAVLSNDFVELHNRSNAAVSLNGLSLQYAAATGTWSASNTHLLPNVMVAPGGYYLVMFASSGANGVALPVTPDFDRDAGTNLSGGSGKIVLVNGTTPITGTCPFDAGVTNVVDFIGYGTTNCVEGTPAPGQNAANADVRGGLGCSDTRFNGSDFSLAAPTPKNSSSTTNVCACP